MTERDGGVFLIHAGFDLSLKRLEFVLQGAVLDDLFEQLTVIRRQEERQLLQLVVVQGLGG